MPLLQTGSRSANGFSATTPKADFPADFNFGTRSREVMDLAFNSRAVLQQEEIKRRLECVASGGPKL